MPLLENNDLVCFWRALLKLGSLEEILCLVSYYRDMVV